MNHENSEVAVLGGALLWHECALTMLERIESPEVFTDERCREVYLCMASLVSMGEPIDAVSVQNEAKRRSSLDKTVSATFMGELPRAVTTRVHHDYHLDAVLDAWLKRRVRAAGEKIAQPDPEMSGEEQVIRARRTVDELDQFATQTIRPKPLTMAELEHTVETAGQGGLALHWAPMSKALGKIDDSGELLIVAARTSIGKTAFALSWALEEAAKGTPVGVISLEKRRPQIQKRLIARMARVQLAKLMFGENVDGEGLSRAEKVALANASAELAKMPLKLLFQADIGVPTAGRVLNSIRQLARYEGCKIVFVDQLYRIALPSSSKHERWDQVMGRVVRDLQMQAAWPLGIAVVLLHQLNRAAEDKEAPKLSDLRDSGQLEMDSDRVLLLQRKRESDGKATTSAKLTVAKASDAWTGTMDMHFAPQCASWFADEFEEGRTFYRREAIPPPTDDDNPRNGGGVQW